MRFAEFSKETEKMCGLSIDVDSIVAVIGDEYNNNKSIIYTCNDKYFEVPMSYDAVMKKLKSYKRKF